MKPKNIEAFGAKCGLPVKSGVRAGFAPGPVPVPIPYPN
jgi:hypothetical protein